MVPESGGPLMPTVLYTSGTEKVKGEVEKELKIPDPENVEAARAQIENSVYTTWDV